MQCEWCVEDLRPAGSFFSCRLYLLEQGSQTASRAVVEPPQEAWHAEPLPHRIEHAELVLPAERRDAPVETPGAGRVVCVPGGTMFARFALVSICRPQGKEFEPGGLVPPHTPEEAGGGGGGGEAQCDCPCICYSAPGVPPTRDDDAAAAVVERRPPEPIGRPPQGGVLAAVVAPPAIPPHFPPVPPPVSPGLTVAGPADAPPHDLPLAPLHPLTPLQAVGQSPLVAAWPDAGRRPEPPLALASPGPRILRPSDVGIRVGWEVSDDRPRARVLMPPLHPVAESGEPRREIGDGGIL